MAKVKYSCPEQQAKYAALESIDYSQRARLKHARAMARRDSVAIGLAKKQARLEAFKTALKNGRRGD